MSTRTHTLQKTAAEAGSDRLINADAERLMVANILAREGFFKRVAASLDGEHFGIERYRRTYLLAKQVHDVDGADPCLSECLRFLATSGKTASELGLPVLSELVYNDYVELANPDRWVRLLRGKAAERRAWRVAERLRLSIEAGADAAGELEAARQELKAIEGALDVPAAQGTLQNAFFGIGIDTLLAEPQGTIQSPWRRLNDLTNGGLKPGELWLLASRPSVGKSTAALQWALHAARSGQRVLFCSLEMPTADLLKRTLSSHGDIPHGLLVRGGLDRSWRFRVAQTLEQIGQYPIEISDRLRSLSDLVARAASTSGLGLLVVDYLGLLDPGGHFENRNQEVSSISRRLKLAALDYNVPVLALHQLNRGNDRENRPPALSDLRDSGSLEQDADAVLLLDAPGQRAKLDGDKDRIEMLIGKQRNGVRDKVSLRLEGKYCRLVEDVAA